MRRKKGYKRGDSIKVFADAVFFTKCAEKFVSYTKSVTFAARIENRIS